MAKDLYKGFKKTADSENSATLEHKNGHKIIVAKSGLDKEHKKQLQKLELHQAEGTQIEEGIGRELASDVGKSLQPIEREVGRDVSLPEPGLAYKAGQAIRENVIAPLAKHVIEPVKDIGAGYQKLGEAAGDVTRDVVAGLTGQAVPEPVKFQPESQQSEAYTNQAGQVIRGTDEDLDLEAEKESGLAARITPPQEQVSLPDERVGGAPIDARPSMEQRIVQPQKVMTPEDIISSPDTTIIQKTAAHNQMYLDAMKRKAAADDEFQLAMREKRIDPNRVYNDMGTGRKIRVMIGMLLGAVGAGFGDGTNAVQKMMDDEIQRDVDAQRADKSEKTNLYKMHLERLGDEALAHQQAVSNLRQAAALEMDYALGKLDPSSPMGKMQINTAKNGLLAQNAQFRAQVAALEQRKKIESMMASGRTENLDPAELVNFMVTDDGAKTAVLKEIADSENLANNAQDILNKFDTVAGEQTVLGRALQPIPFKKLDSAGALEQSLEPFFKDFQGQSRTADKLAAYERMVPSLSDTDEDIRIKRNALITWMKATSSAPTARSYKIPLDKFKRTRWVDPLSETKKKWESYVRRNEGDPKRQGNVEFIKRKYGIR